MCIKKSCKSGQGEANNKNMELFINAKMAEYKEMRAEIRVNVQLQWTIMTVFFTIFGVLFTLVLKQYEAAEATVAQAQQTCIGFFLLPAISAVCGVLWLDQVHRQIRVGNYIYQLEEKINTLLMPQAIHWEHEVDRDNYRGAWKPLNANLFNYYVTLAVFYLFPIFTIYHTYQITKIINVWFYIGTGDGLLFVFFSILQIRSIMKSRRRLSQKNITINVSGV